MFFGDGKEPEIQQKEKGIRSGQHFWKSEVFTAFESLFFSPPAQYLQDSGIK